MSKPPRIELDASRVLGFDQTLRPRAGAVMVGVPKPPPTPGVLTPRPNAR